MSEWFYIQKWAMQRWKWVGVELDFSKAKDLYKQISSGSTEKPFALLKRDTKGMVITEKKDHNKEWEIVTANSIFIAKNNLSLETLSKNFYDPTRKY